jgi:hypothetical protein
MKNAFTKFFTVPSLFYYMPKTNAKEQASPGKKQLSAHSQSDYHVPISEKRYSAGLLTPRI